MRYFAKKDVIMNLYIFLKKYFLLAQNLLKLVSSVKVIINDVIKPSVIIHPKSIIGFISLKIKDRKAIIVVKTVYKYWPKHFICC